MKDINGNDLQQPYYDLAVMRREQQKGSNWVRKCNQMYESTKGLRYAFDWCETPEGHSWWDEVFKGNPPSIPDTYLAKLEAWGKEKGINKDPMDAMLDEYFNNLSDEKLAEMEKKINAIFSRFKTADTTDWKAKYEELEKEANELTSTLKELGAKYDEIKYGAAEPSKFIAECAMRAMQAMLSNADLMEVVTSGLGLGDNVRDKIARVSFDYAEAMAAEGKKRGHIN